MPKAGVFKQSEVFQALNDEQLKSKAEQEREEKYQWTTFLQKPQRPPPQRTSETVVTNTYKPMIVKQPKPKCAPDYRVPTPVSYRNFYKTCNLWLISFRNQRKFKFKSHNNKLRASLRRASLNKTKSKSILNAKATWLKCRRTLS